MSGPPRALVFGGSGALGSAVCEALAQDGARVAFTYWRGESRTLALKEKLPGAIARRVDVSSVREIEEAVDAVASEMGGIDAWIQCAAVAVTTERSRIDSHHLIEDVDERGWDRMMDVNAKSTFFAVRRLVPLMKTTGGNIVLIGSIDGVKPVPSPVHYAAAKGALAGMTTAMAKELGAHRIRVNMVAPGILEAGISRDIPANLLEEYLKHCGLRRVGRTEEIAGLVAWLACHNTYVTGQVVLVDGAL